MTAAAKPFPMHEREFVALMASIMALNALAIDAMLPAFPAIRESLNVADPNSLQYMITAYMLANAVGSLVATGPHRRVLARNLPRIGRLRGRSSYLDVAPPAGNAR